MVSKNLVLRAPVQIVPASSSDELRTTLLFELCRHLAKHTVEDLVSQIHRFIDGRVGREHSDIYLIRSRQAHAGDDARAQVDEGAVEFWQVLVRVEHEDSIGE